METLFVGSFKKKKKLRLDAALDQCPEGLHALREIMALPLLPANEIERAFNELVTSLSAPTRRIMGPLLRYYRRQWLRKVTPQIFSVHNYRRRTNNNIESYHRTLKDRFGLHSNIWTFSGKIL